MTLVNSQSLKDSVDPASSQTSQTRDLNGKSGDQSDVIHQGSNNHFDSKVSRYHLDFNSKSIRGSRSSVHQLTSHENEECAYLPKVETLQNLPQQLSSISASAFACSKCGKKFTRRPNLVRHEKIHVGDRPFACSVCPKAFSQLTHLKKHFTTHKTSTETSVEKLSDVAVCSEKGNGNAINLGDLAKDGDFLRSDEKESETARTERKVGKEEGEPFLISPESSNSLSPEASSSSKSFATRYKQPSPSTLQPKTTSSHRNPVSKPFKCLTCQKSFTKSENLAFHKKLHSNLHKKSRKHSCSECHKLFSSVSGLYHHRRSHSKSAKRFLCSHCPKSFLNSSNLTTHLRIHTGEKPFRCDDCGKSFTQSTTLIAHKRIHSGEKPFKCPECGKGFAQSCNLRTHKFIHRTEKAFQCSFCSKSFSSSADLSRHRQIHSRKFKCPDCPKSFGDVEKFSSHRRLHSTQLPYECQVCEKAFKTSSSLKNHRLVHSMEKPFVCNFCGKGFSRNQYLVRHTRIHTGEKPYSCRDCSKAFSQRTHLNKHLLTHGKRSIIRSRGDLSQKLGEHITASS